MNDATDPAPGTEFDEIDEIDDVDVRVLEMVRTIYETVDPVPGEAYSRVHFALDLESADTELATLCAELEAETLVRGSEQATTMSFETRSLTITLTIAAAGPGRFRLDGWLSPAGSLRIELRTLQLRIQAMSDEAGRFVIHDVAPGEVQLAVHPTPGSEVDLARTVLTPSIVL
jgi:hypothetical protein